MPLVQILALLLGLSVLGNAVLYRTHLGTRDALVEATGARDQARAAATSCSAATVRLADAARTRAAEGLRAMERARATSRGHQVRAQEILAAPPAVPGDDCRSAQTRAQAWISSRSKP